MKNRNKDRTKGQNSTYQSLQTSQPLRKFKSREELNTFIIGLQKKSVQNVYFFDILKDKQQLHLLKQEETVLRSEIRKKKEQLKRMDSVLVKSQSSIAENTFQKDIYEDLCTLVLKSNLVKVAQRQKKLLQEIDGLCLKSNSLNVRDELRSEHSCVQANISLVEQWNKWAKLQSILASRQKCEALQYQMQRWDQSAETDFLSDGAARELKEGYEQLSSLESEIRKLRRVRLRLAKELQALSEQTIQVGVFRSEIEKMETRIGIWTAQCSVKEKQLRELRQRKAEAEKATRLQDSKNVQLKNTLQVKKEQEQRDTRLMQEQINKTKLAYEQLFNKYRQLTGKRVQ